MIALYGYYSRGTRLPEMVEVELLRRRAAAHSILHHQCGVMHVSGDVLIVLFPQRLSRFPVKGGIVPSAAMRHCEPRDGSGSPASSPRG